MNIPKVVYVKQKFNRTFILQAWLNIKVYNVDKSKSCRKDYGSTYRLLEFTTFHITEHNTFAF